MAVEIVELLEVEAAPALLLMSSMSNHSISLLGRDDLVVAVAPAEAHEIIAQRGRQIAHGAVCFDALRAVTLRQLGAVRTVDQRHVRELRHVPAHAL